ncbi:DUF2975 domain-containing protein [Alkaliphilus sp. B6464]|uniref:DUF2975 domain-containing protein n=1 Tax=Alkaliphilus sp. B6464 TaxID=2731219 RepID=UPI001BA55109|nr:DUF2975 domain-containing protein [Alkaliphilus sp. B6464]QUH19253.1 DUF2975 domain-containing protein [Alkaliphilus sp. B6464]
MKRWMLNVLRMYITFIGIVILLLCIFWLPDMARISAELNPEVAYLKYPILIGIYLTCIPFYLAIFKTFKLVKLIGKDGAFTEDACKSLRVITLCAISVIVLYIIGIFYLSIENALPPGLFLLGLIIILVASIISIFAAVLKALLIKVVEIKNENDFTI